MADTRKAHPTYGDDAEEMTLDYTIHRTTSALLAAFRNRNDRRARKYGDDFGLQLNMLDGKLPLSTFWHVLTCTFVALINVYKQRQGELKFRSDLCEKLDEKIRLLQIGVALASPFLKNSPYSGMNEDGVVEQRIYSGTQRRAFQHPSSQHLYSSIPFSWVLPEFMLLSATAVDIIRQDPSPQWMEMAAEFMVHDAVSRFHQDPFRFDPETACNESFAWCFIPEEEQAFEPRHADYIRDQTTRVGSYEAIKPKIWFINDMFRSKSETSTSTSTSSPAPIEPEAKASKTPDPKELPGWQTIRQTHLSRTLKLFAIPPTGTAATTTPPTTLDYKSLTSTYPLTPFITLLLDFFESMIPHLGVPVLIQLEDGELESEGLGREETAEFLRRIGVR